MDRNIQDGWVIGSPKWFNVGYEAGLEWWLIVCNQEAYLSDKEDGRWTDVRAEGGVKRCMYVQANTEEWMWGLSSG